MLLKKRNPNPTQLRRSLRIASKKNKIKTLNPINKQF